MARRILLLGDSIIDNGAYVGPGEPDVAAQLYQRLPNYDVVKRAVDGTLTRDVLRQTAAITKDDYVVLSSGGNDALSRLDLIDTSTVGNSQALLLQMWHVREDFRTNYVNLLRELTKAEPKVLILTIYNPCFDRDAGAPTEMQRAAEAALSIFNDVIQTSARDHGAEVLDLRRLFVNEEDYANSIEPSAIGGAKISAEISRWVESRS